MKIHSLRAQLLLLFVLIVFVTLGAFAIFSSQLLQNGLQTYLAGQEATDQQLIAQIRATYHQPQDRPRLQVLIEQSANQTNIRTLVIDQSQRILADSARQLIGQTLTIPLFLALDRVSAEGPPLLGAEESEAPVRIVSTDGKVIASGLQPVIARHLFSSANRALLLAVLVSGLIAFILALLLSGAILRPVHALTRAAQRLEQGDLSQRVRIQRKDELGGLAHAFDTMAASLENSERQRHQLLSDIAHELRTPLTNIRGYLEALQDGFLEPDGSTFSSIYEEALFLSRLVTDLQDLTLAEAGQLRLYCVPLAVEDVIARAVNALALQAEYKKLSLVVDLAPDLPLVEADAQRVEQIIRNLLSNAIKYTPAEGSIRVLARTVGDTMEVCVQDSGPGIAAKHLPFLFQHFYRADTSRTRETGGSGLGLAIVEQLVHAHGGRVQVTSTPGQGTRFFFTLPIAPL